VAGDVWGFQRTYEELKLFQTLPFLRVIPSFQRTYEELKLHKNFNVYLPGA